MRCKNMEISPRSHAIKQTMLNTASEKWAINKNTHFSNGFCRFQVAISGAKRVHTCKIGGPTRHIFHDFPFVPLSKSCFPPRAGSIFSENRMIFCKKSVRSMEGTKKTADRIRNRQNCCIDAYTHFC